MEVTETHGFNLAMLGKQGWNLQSNPDALFTRIFKARYFPQGDFLGARLGHNPSFIWRSIHASQVLVRQGARWCIGNGSSINIWKDPWLRNSHSSYVTSTAPQGYESLTVHDLIDRTLHKWDSHRVQTLFNHQDAQSILSIPLNLAQTASPVVNHRWTKPPADTFTCNVDAVLFNDSSTFGFEAAAMLEAIQYLIHSPYDNVCVETDCKQVADHLNSPQVLHSEYGIIINQCRSLLRSHQNLQVRFIRRQANRVAHTLARVARSSASHHFFNFIPPCIASLIINEMS
uniref:RNase H type-1 domain-containing protein n=1 Tax=Cajanus cajan TaxID=3821 RepID=A0A151QM87_CAJCA|nr:hypothetical protein KK1_048281 [Cajanus cajan]